MSQSRRLLIFVESVSQTVAGTLRPCRELTTCCHKEIVFVLFGVFHLHLIVNFHFLPTVFHISPLFSQLLIHKRAHLH